MKKQICLLAFAFASLSNGPCAFAAADWEWQVPPATGNDLLGITYTGSAFFAVGRAGNVVTSTTGALGSWQHIPSPSIPTPVQKQYDFLGVASHGNTIVAVASTRSNAMTPAGYVVTSTDNGMTWKLAFTASDRLIGVTYSTASGQFIAVGGGDKMGGLVYKSDDGTAWTQVGTAISGVEFDAVASNGTEVAAVGTNGVVYMSLDQKALAFTSQTLVFDTTHTDGDTKGRDMHAIVGNPANRDFYAVGENSALLHFAPKASSPGMGIWTAFQLTSSNVSTPQPKINGSLRAIALLGSTYLVMGDITSGYSQEIHVTESGTTHAYDLEKWVTTPPPAEIMSQAVLDTQRTNSIATNGTMFVAVGDNGSYTTSKDAVTWSYDNPGAARLHAIATDGTNFVAGGEGGEVLHSSDAGTTWSPVLLPTPHIAGLGVDVSALKFGASHFVAVTGFSNGDGTIFTSPTGAVWKETLTTTPVSPATLAPKLMGLDYDKAHGIFVAVGRSDLGSNVVVSLDDGATWTITAGDAIVPAAGLTGANAVLTGIAYDGTDNSFMAVGIDKGANSIALKGTVGGTAPNFTVTWTKFGSPFSDAGSSPNNVIPTAIAWSEKDNVFVVSGGVENDTGETVVSNAGATLAKWTDENNNLPAGIDHVLGLAYNKSDDTFIGLGKGSLVMTRPAATVGAWTLVNTGAEKGVGPLANQEDDTFFGALALPGSTFLVGGFQATNDTISKIMHLQSGTTPVRLQEFSVE